MTVFVALGDVILGGGEGLRLSSKAVSLLMQDDEDDHAPSQGHDGAGVLHQPLVGVEHGQRHHAHEPPWS